MTYLSSTVKTLRKKNETNSRFQNCRFHKFAPHYESAELVENILLTDKRLHLKLILNPQNQQKKSIKAGFYLKDNNRAHLIQELVEFK